MAKQYRVHAYNVGPRVGDQNGDDAHAHMDAMTEDGWVVHTATVQYPELSVLWERDKPGDGDDSGPPESSAVAEPAPASAAKHARTTGRRAGAPSG
jgi:hypothetical protein